MNVDVSVINKHCNLKLHSLGLKVRQSSSTCPFLFIPPNHIPCEKRRKPKFMHVKTLGMTLCTPARQMHPSKTEGNPLHDGEFSDW